MRLPLSSLLLPLLATGCAEPLTAITLEVRSDALQVPDDVDGLRFEIEVEGGGPRAERAFTLQGGWPHSLAVTPGRAPEDAALVAVVTATKGSRFVVRRVIRTAFSPGEQRRVPVVLEAACRGVRCAEGVDCVGGRCVGEEPLDGGSRDGAADGGGVPDGGREAGPDATSEGGTDAGADASADASDEPDAAPPADPCGPTREACNGLDDDGDGLTDEGLPCPGALVISELATAGPSGSSDEFVEIHNRTGQAVCIENLRIEYRSASGARFSTRATLPLGAWVPAHGYFLATSAGYDPTLRGGVASDLAPGARWTTGFAGSGGHVRLVHAGRELDRLGWGTAVEPEGTAVSALGVRERSGSYERKASPDSTAESLAPGGAEARCGNGLDSDDNAADFVHREAAEPQNAGSEAEPPCGG